MVVTSQEKKMVPFTKVLFHDFKKKKKSVIVMNSKIGLHVRDGEEKSSLLEHGYVICLRHL